MRTIDPRILATVMFLVMLTALPAAAGLGDLQNNLDRRPMDSRQEGEPADTGSVQADRPELTPELTEKINAGEPISQDEFMNYLKAVEAANPGMSWRQIITRLHQNQYPQDHVCKVAGIPLFRDDEGGENRDWEKVDMLTRNAPKLVQDADGNIIDIAHSYAGIRAQVNRGAVNGWLMGRVNTGWGDSLQVYNDVVGGAKDLAKAGLLTHATIAFPPLAFKDARSWEDVKKIAAQPFGPQRKLLSGAWDSLKSGWKLITESGKWKPDSQVRGNEMGNDIQSYLRDHPDATLTEGYEAVFRGK